MAVTEQEAPGYLSPKRVLARAFEDKPGSLEKRKYKLLQEELESLSTDVRDLNAAARTVANPPPQGARPWNKRPTNCVPG